MNERIQELVKQAKDYATCSQYTSGYHREEIFHEKFAELIVQECATWVNDNVGMITEEARADLLKHFGVEE